MRDERKTTAECLVLTGIVIAQMSLGNASLLMHRHFDLDEMHTLVLVDDPDVGHSLRALANGVDANPPTLFLLMRAFVLPFGGPDEFSLRAFSVAAMLVCIAAVYAALRQSFSMPTALVAVLILWSHPLLVRYAFDARFYGVWLAGVAGVGCLLRDDSERRPSLARLALLSLVSAFVAVVHYFGIVSLVLMCAGHVVANRKPKRRLAAAAACFLPALLAVTATLPMMQQQRSAFSIATWVPDTSLEVIGWCLGLLLAVPILALGIAVLLQRCFPRGDAAATHAGRIGIPSHWEQIRPYGGYLGLLLMPIVLLLFSFVVQPVMQPRYLLPTVIGFAPLFAAVLARVRRNVLLVAGACLIVAGVVSTRRHAQSRIEQDPVRPPLEVVQRLPDDAPIVFDARYQFYPLIRYGPQPKRYFLLDFDDGDLERPPRDRVFNRDIARRIAEWYPQFQLLRPRSAGEFRKLYVVVSPLYDRGDATKQLAKLFPGWRIRQREPRVFELTSSVGR